MVNLCDMAGFDANLEALTACGRTAITQAGDFGGLCDAFSATAGDASIFGGLDDSGSLAGAVHGVHTAVRDQFGLAANLLQGVERAIDAVERTLRDAEGVAAPKPTLE